MNNKWINEILFQKITKKNKKQKDPLNHVAYRNY